MYDLEALGFGPDFAAAFEQYESEGLSAASPMRRVVLETNLAADEEEVRPREAHASD